ncbi:hypothetical protein HOLleu_42606 [Holothuria leucospilota]|uniref:Uncharacterized protein n=1 Tax=Holothuria leucospilota TaxID=206669 RepID=A0A9Q1BB92_HOLLE|nr:hypothetical protein HOLleu_42606 [Holothuria leucospilota]
MVEEVDPFNYNVAVVINDDLKLLDVTDLDKPSDKPCSSDSPLKQKPKRQKKKRRGKNTSVRSTDITVSDHIGGFASLFSITGEKIECGSKVSIGNNSLSSVSWIVTSLSYEGGAYVGEAMLLADHSIKLKGPLEKFQLGGPLRKDELKLSKSLFQNAFLKSINISKESFSFRRIIRQNHLGALIRGEIKKLLVGRNSRKVILLGVFLPETDLDLLGIHPRKRTVLFSYNKKNIHMLDSFLGPNQWDVVLKENCLRFVTRVTFKLGKGEMLSCIVAAASAMNIQMIDGSYRSLLENEFC